MTDGRDFFSPDFLSTEENSMSIHESNANNSQVIQGEYKEEQKKEVLTYLRSKLRMIRLLRKKTFPPSRDFIQETVNVMSVPETIRDATPRKADTYY